MNKLKNYIGQLRVYSLADLVLLLFAVGASQYQMVGAVLLHLAFLAYLEHKHHHEYRAPVPVWLSLVLAAAGMFFYRKIEVVFYILFSFLYTKKTKKLGFISPICRGLQNLFLVAGILSYTSPLVYIVGLLLLFRNLLGDFRDIEKDKGEGMNTIPVLLGFTKNVKYAHLAGVMLTTFVWWCIAPLSVMWLIVIWGVQIATYNLTPR